MSRAAIALAMTGASGAPYGLRLLQALLESGQHVQMIISDPGRMVVNMETELKLPGRTTDIQSALEDHVGAHTGQLQVFGKDEWTAPLASGSNAPRACVVCPCSSGTLAAIASGHSRNLIDRTADVVLKERRKLILVPRETPVSAIHLDNMLRLAHAGAVILPANPGFYNKPTRVEELVDFIIARILDHLDIEHSLAPRWGA